MDLQLQETINFSDPQTFCFQPCFSNDGPSYLVYVAPNGESAGRFVQEEGGLVWFSKNFPNGETCDTYEVSKEFGDRILSEIVKDNSRGVERAT